MPFKVAPVVWKTEAIEVLKPNRPLSQLNSFMDQFTVYIGTYRHCPKHILDGCKICYPTLLHTAVNNLIFHHYGKSNVFTADKTYSTLTITDQLFP